MKRTRNACTSPLRCAGRWAAVSRAEQQTAAEAAAAHLNVMFCVASCRLAARLPALGLDVTSMVYRTFIGWLYHLIRAMTLTLRLVTGGRVPCLSRFLPVRCSCPALPCPVPPFPRVVPLLQGRQTCSSQTACQDLKMACAQSARPLKNHHPSRKPVQLGSCATTPRRTHLHPRHLKVVPMTTTD